MESIKSFEKIMDSLAYRHSVSTVFADFLDLVICCLSGQRMEERYFEIIARYKPDEQTKFPELFAELVILMEKYDDGLFDVLGEFFMMHITRGQNGQFFTPQCITDMMAHMTCGEKQSYRQTICDPACGSGRTLLSAAKVLGKANFYYGADLDHNCAKMTVINMCLNDLCGQVGHMDTLKYELYNCYEVYRDATRFNVPTIRVLDKEHSVFYTHPDAFKKAIEETAAPSKKRSSKTPVAQLDLFSTEF